MVKLFLLVVLVNYLAGPGILRLQVNSCGDVEVWRGSGEVGFCISPFRQTSWTISRDYKLKKTIVGFVLFAEISAC
jgi:hypothetical protein